MQLVTDFFNKYQIEPESLAVGVSGGADSLALVLLLKEAFPRCHLVALTVDHGLRPTSLKEAQYVAGIMVEHGIEHHILTWNGKKPKTGIEEKARVARYNLLCGWCYEHHVQYLAVAHHLLDQAETFLMRIIRGSGLYGLSSMREIYEMNGICILRPLLQVHPDELKAYLKEKNINWVEDESNQCDDFLRVRIRKFLPKIKQNIGLDAKHLGEAAAHLQKTRDFIEDMVNKNIQEHVHFWSNIGCSFDYAVFSDWHNELKFYVLGELVKQIGQNIYIPEAEALQKLIDQVQDTDFSCTTLGNVYFCKIDLRLWLIRENRHVKMQFSEKKWDLYCTKNPEVRGIKIPAKLKMALLYEKNYEK